MPENTYVNKVIINGVTKIDLTGDTVDQSKLLTGYTAHDASGAPITGNCTYNADTSDATAVPGEILSGSTAYGAAGTKLTGTMTNNGAVTGTITTKSQVYTVPQGYHDGSGTVQISSTEQAKIIEGNIKNGVEILGVTGTYEGEGGTGQAKTVTPTFATQAVLPDSGYDYLTQVTVNAIPVYEADNPQGGITVTVGDTTQSQQMH